MKYCVEHILLEWIRASYYDNSKVYKKVLLETKSMSHGAYIVVHRFSTTGCQHKCRSALTLMASAHKIH